MADARPAPTGTTTDAFLHGVRTASTSVFALVIIFTYIGFGAMCHDYGFPVGWAMAGEAGLVAGALAVGH